MNTLVIGGSGFIGSHVSDELTDRNYNVTICDIHNSPYKRLNQKMIIKDVLIDNIEENNGIIYNFAGVSDMDNENKSNIVVDNIKGNINILEYCRKNDINRYIFASSIYVYSDKGSFYRISKQANESIIQEYNRLYGIPYTILRYGSIYGPRANKHNWIYKVICQALKEQKITRQGDGEEIREYIYVKDAAKLSVDILDKKYENKNIMITGTQSIKIRDLHKMISEILGNEISLEYINTDIPNEHYNITPYSLNIKPALKLVNNPSYDLGQGLLECIKDIHKTI